jgi:two-component system sensor histidine kinase MprB
MSFRRRLVLLSAAAVAVTVAASAAAVYVIVRQQLRDSVVDQLRTRAAIHAARGYANIRQLRPLEGPRVPEPPTLPRLIAPDGGVLAARYPRLQYPVTAAARAVAAGTKASSLEDVDFRGTHLEVLTVHAGAHRALQLAQSLDSTDDTLHRLLLALVGVSVAAAVAAPFVGLAVAGGALRPVRRLRSAAEDVARTGDLDFRIDAGGRDELASLASSFNAMIERLAGMVKTVERAQAAQRQLVADASHELRTPLASLRANVELLELASPSGVQRAELVEDVLEQLDDLTLLVGQLIDLAREDVREAEHARVAFDDVVAHELERVLHNYPHVRFTASLEPTTVRGSRDSLTRAVSNLLDNAAKWSSDGARVEVTLRGGELRVRDHGPGIADEDLPHVFERFYRGRGTRDHRGSGLGLAVVAQVASSHGGDVRAAHADGGGAVLTLTVPRAGS